VNFRQNGIFLKVISFEFSVSFIISISFILVCSRKENFSVHVRKCYLSFLSRGHSLNSHSTLVQCEVDVNGFLVKLRIVSTHGRVPRRVTFNKYSDYYPLCVLSVFLLARSLQVIWISAQPTDKLGISLQSN